MLWYTILFLARFTPLHLCAVTSRLEHRTRAKALLSGALFCKLECLLSCAERAYAPRSVRQEMSVNEKSLYSAWICTIVRFPLVSTLFLFAYSSSFFSSFPISIPDT